MCLAHQGKGAHVTISKAPITELDYCHPRVRLNTGDYSMATNLALSLVDNCSFYHVTKKYAKLAVFSQFFPCLAFSGGAAVKRQKNGYEWTKSVHFEKWGWGVKNVTLFPTERPTERT